MFFWWWCCSSAAAVPFAFDAYTAISAKCRGTFYTAANRPTVFPPLRTRIGWGSIAWPDSIYPSVSTIWNSIICIERWPMDRHIWWPISVDRMICVRHVRRMHRTNRPMPKRHHQVSTTMTSNCRSPLSPRWCESHESTCTKKWKSTHWWCGYAIKWNNAYHAWSTKFPFLGSTTVKCTGDLSCFKNR